jgi:hypothetical protein
MAEATIDTIKQRLDSFAPEEVANRTLASNLDILMKMGPDGKYKLPDITPFETDLANALNQASPPGGDFQRLRYEFLLDSGIQYLVRAIALRDDGQELALRAVNDFLSRWKSQRDLEIAAGDLTSGAFSKELEALEGQLRSLEDTKKHEHSSDDALFELHKGLLEAEIVRVKGMVEAKKLQAEQNRLSLRVVYILNAIISQRNTQHGHALNHIERIAVAKSAFRQNFLEAHSRLKAVASVLPLIFASTQTPDAEAIVFPRFPTVSAFNEVGFVDTLLAWAREVVARLDRITRFDTDYRIVISKLEYEFTTKQKSGTAYTFKPTLTAEHFPGLSDLRVRNVRVSTVPATPTDNANTDQFRKYHGVRRSTVTLPDQRRFGNETISVPKLTIGDSSTYSASGTQSDISSVLNATPLGTWDISIGEREHGNDTATPEPPYDIWLEITVRGLSHLA